MNTLRHLAQDNRMKTKMEITMERRDPLQDK